MTLLVKLEHPQLQRKQSFKKLFFFLVCIQWVCATEINVFVPYFSWQTIIYYNWHKKVSMDSLNFGTPSDHRMDCQSLHRIMMHVHKNFYFLSTWTQTCVQTPLRCFVVNVYRGNDVRLIHVSTCWMGSRTVLKMFSYVNFQQSFYKCGPTLRVNPPNLSLKAFSQESQPKSDF